MSSLKALYNATNKIIQNSEVGNYFPPRIYTDVDRIKYQKEKKQKKYQKDKPTKKIDRNIKKNTFLQLIEKRQKNLPSPNSYKPNEYQPQYKSRQIKNYPSRITIFEEKNKENIKNPIPSACDYKTQQSLEKIKIKSTSLMSYKFCKAENSNFIDGALHSSIQNPGIGQYSLNIKKGMSKYQSQSKLGKFNKAKKSDSLQLQKVNTPSPNTYQPKLLTKNLFSQIQKTKASSSNFNKQKRFESSEAQKNSSKNMFYSGISQWGMKTNYKKKDLLDVLSKHNVYSKSVYYH